MSVARRLKEASLEALKAYFGNHFIYVLQTCHVDALFEMPKLFQQNSRLRLTHYRGHQLPEFVTQVFVGQRRLGITFSGWLKERCRSTVIQFDPHMGRSLSWKRSVQHGINAQFDAGHQIPDGRVGQTLRTERSQSNAAIQQCRSHHIGNAEPRLRSCDGLKVARNIQSGTVGGNMDAMDFMGLNAHLLSQSQGAIDGCKGVTATSMVLEGHAVDMKNCP